MTMRQLWQDIMHYRSFDRVPVIHWGTWMETKERWYREGLPPDVKEQTFFNATGPFYQLGFHLTLYPTFEERTIEETDEYRTFYNKDGVVVKWWKNKSSIPAHYSYTFQGARQWDQFKALLQPDPGRIPADFDQHLAAAESCGQPISIQTASLMGWVRNWMGVENLCYLMYDSPDVFADVVDTLAELTCWQIDQIVPRMKTRPDMGYGWEDICGRSGPLVSPEIFRRCVAPGYRKIRAKLESYGIGLLGIDSDGYIEPLLPCWLDAGVNLHFPIEIGVWKADPLALRRRFGRELRMIGGFNKLVLEQGRDAIDAELERRLPLVREGGYVMMPDHLITPGVPLADYQYYLDRVRELRF